MPINPLPLSKTGNMQWKVTTEPSGEPVSVEEVKNYARISSVADDEYLGELIVAVRQVAEGYLGRALITQSITCYMDFWPSNPVGLPRPPAQSITAVRTRDEDGVATTYDSDNYFLVSSHDPALLVIKSSAVAPDNTSLRTVAGYEIEFVAGYGNNATDVPRAIKEGLLLWIASAYDSREIGSAPPPEARKSLDSYKMMRV
jgi:uncharacterized phiE125 gp8 family phage protein